MSILFLVRHGRSTANTAGVLAGRTEGVQLDETGQEQARAVGHRLVGVPLVGVVCSPIERCVQTADLVLGDRQVSRYAEPGLTECDYGRWSGLKLKDLAGEPLWKTVQQQPSAAVFPDGEGLSTMHARAVAAARGWDRRFSAEHGPLAAWAAVTHGDIVKSILADALGLHLDQFQRIMVDPGAVSVIRYTEARPYVVTMNSTHGELGALLPTESGEDATVGGGTGTRQAPEQSDPNAEPAGESRNGA